MTKRIGGLSFGSEEAYQKFVSLSKDEQIDKLANSLSPKDRVQAESLLAHTPNGDSSTVKAENKGGNAKRPASGGKGADNAKPNTATTEG